MQNQSIISEFWEFLKFRKCYWLLTMERVGKDTVLHGESR